MDTRKRMSPLTALFLGFFGFGAVTIASVSAVVLYAMRMIDGKVNHAFSFAHELIDELPELMESLPPAVETLLDDHRAPEYAAELNVEAHLVTGGGRDEWIYPSVIVTNNGNETVSFLTLRVAALNAEGVPVGEWTQVVATPLGFDRDWRGPLLPGNRRYAVLRDWGGLKEAPGVTLTPAVEIVDVRVRNDAAGAVKTAHAE